MTLTKTHCQHEALPLVPCQWLNTAKSAASISLQAMPCPLPAHDVCSQPAGQAHGCSPAKCLVLLRPPCTPAAGVALIQVHVVLLIAAHIQRHAALAGKPCAWLWVRAGCPALRKCKGQG